MSLVGAENNSRGKNLARLFSRFVDDFRVPADQSIICAITDLPSTSNMMKFFSKLLELKLLEASVIARAKEILKPVHQFMVMFYFIAYCAIWMEGVNHYETFKR